MMIFNMVAAVVMTLSLIAVMNAKIRDHRVRATVRASQNRHDVRR
ncbi:hypothetical protein [Bradyrhizobium prioriisuperbiae]|nr:hypothetical protein [Bradyrhizobium prioritasuperba]